MNSNIADSIKGRVFSTRLEGMEQNLSEGYSSSCGSNTRNGLRKEK